jgi:hypothetical protein
MTFLGKAFVMINVAISLLMAFVALGLYFNGTDWGYDVAEPGKQGGLIEMKKKEIAEVQQGLGPSENAWKAARPTLWKAEEERREARAEYVKQLQYNLAKATKTDGAKAVVMEEKKDPKLGPIKVPERVPGKRHLPKMEVAKSDDGDPLSSRAYYRAELQKVNQLNHDLRRQFEQASKKDEDLNKLIYDKATDTGLQVDLVVERDKREAVQAERRQVRPLYVNTAVESELSIKRLEQMRGQIAALRAYCAKRGIDVQVAKR